MRGNPTLIRSVVKFYALILFIVWIQKTIIAQKGACHYVETIETVFQVLNYETYAKSFTELGSAEQAEILYLFPIFINKENHLLHILPVCSVVLSCKLNNLKN